MKEYIKEFVIDWENSGGLIGQQDAADLLQWSRQRIYSRIKTESLKSYEYKHGRKKKVFVALNDIKNIAIMERNQHE